MHGCLCHQLHWRHSVGEEKRIMKSELNVWIQRSNIRCQLDFHKEHWIFSFYIYFKFIQNDLETFQIFEVLRGFSKFFLKSRKKMYSTHFLLTVFKNIQYGQLVSFKCDSCWMLTAHSTRKFEAGHEVWYIVFHQNNGPNTTE